MKSEFKGVMTILFKDKVAQVFASKFDDWFELMYFCGGGISLARDYFKKKHK